MEQKLIISYITAFFVGCKMNHWICIGEPAILQLYNTEISDTVIPYIFIIIVWQHYFIYVYNNLLSFQENMNAGSYGKRINHFIDNDPKEPSHSKRNPWSEWTQFKNFWTVVVKLWH